MRTKLFVIVALLLLVGCTSTEDRTPAKYDVRDHDVFQLMFDGTTTSLDVGIDDVKLGDSKKHVLKQLGSPVNFTRFEGDGLVIENYEYKFGAEKTAVIIHMQNERVGRITFKKPMNQLLKGLTQIDQPSEEFFFDYGVPDEKEIVYRMIVMKYNEVGLEIITYLGDEVSFSLVPPSETNRTINTIPDLVYIPYSQNMVFT